MRRACDRASARDAMDADDAMGDAGDGDAGARGRAATTAPRGEGAGKNRAIRSIDCRVASTRRALASSMRLTRAARARDAQTISAGFAWTGTPRTERCARDDARRRARLDRQDRLFPYKCDFLGENIFRARSRVFGGVCVNKRSDRDRDRFASDASGAPGARHGGWAGAMRLTDDRAFASRSCIIRARVRDGRTPSAWRGGSCSARGSRRR